MSLFSYSNVMATVAVFVALGGSSYAAISLSDNSVKSRHIAKGQVKSSDVADGSLVAGDFKAGALAAGPQGPAAPQGPAGAEGPAGPVGPQGEPATRLYAAISYDGALLHGEGVTNSVKHAPGSYTVTFDRSLDECVATAGHYNEKPLTSPSPANHFALTRMLNKPDTLHVAVWNSSTNSVFSVSFAIVAFC
jgi:hypothetical protein